MNERDLGLELVRFPAAMLGAIGRTLADQLGAAEAARALQQAGLESGDAFYERFREWLEERGSGIVDVESLPAEEFWARLSEFFSFLGWGRLQSELAHTGVISLTLTDWVEARQQADGLGGCYFTTGLVAEVLRRIAGGDLAALEVECDPTNGGTSRILVGNTESLDALFASMRDGVRYEDALANLT